MAEPKAITYKEVEKAVGKDGSQEAWAKVCHITGAGNVPVNSDGEASIDITELADGKKAQIDEMLAPKKTKEGAK